MPRQDFWQAKPDKNKFLQIGNFLVYFHNRAVVYQHPNLLQPVYQDEKVSQIPAERRRSQSAPNLTEWPVLEKIPMRIEYSSSEDEEETRMQFEKQRMTRRKALSENLFKHSALRMHSETDLTKIDRNATFNNAAYVERSELMARMSDAFKTTYNRMQLPRSSDSTTETDDEEPGKRKVSSSAESADSLISELSYNLKIV